MDQIPEANPSANSSSPKNPEETRPCSKCKARVPVTDPHKWCEGCREKARLRSAKSVQKKRALLEAQHGQEDNVLRELKRKLDGRADATQSEKKRRKTSHASDEIKRKADSEVENKKTNPGNKNDVEYQTASEMYSKLKTHSKIKKYLFNGHFSIIASPETDNIGRVKLVAKDLRKLAKIPFEGKSVSSSKVQSSFCAIFRCKCQGTKPVPSLHNRDPNAIVSNPLGSAVDKHSVPRCKGTIKVMSENDSSHPLGIAGQKITVTVEH